MDCRYITRRSLVKQIVAGTSAFGSLCNISLRAQTPVSVTVPTVTIGVPITVADGLVVERVYDRTFADQAVPAWVLDVRNTTDRTWAIPELFMSFVRTDGAAVGQARPFPLLEIIRAGQLAPYTVEFHDFNPAQADWSRVDFSVRGPWPSPPVYADDVLEIRDVTEKSNGRTWKVSGTVVNASDLEIGSVAVTAIIRTHAGDFLGNIATTIPTPIPPGESAPFICDAADAAAVLLDPFAVADDARAFEAELMATPMAMASLG